MKRWLRRIAMFAAGTWAVVAGVSLYSIYLARSTPDWYSPQRLSEIDEENMANQSTQTAADLFSYASDVAAAQRRASIAGTPADPIAPKTITLSEIQLNAFLARCAADMGGKVGGQFGHYFSEPRVALIDGRLIVAGLVHDLGAISGSVVSVEIQPSLDEQGHLWPRFTHIYNGRLPIPLSILDRPRKNLEVALENALPDWQIGAGVGRDGLANRDAATAVAAKLLLAGLSDKSADAVILVPCAVGDMRQTVPLRITDLTIADRRLTVTLAPLSSAQLHSLLDEISQ